ncbi:transcription elongation factor GreB [Acetobacteraceae bacterium]|nr:transcription elongation factor GreB [Acetobacteraceae bacterium]
MAEINLSIRKYLSEKGAARFRAELDQLRLVERPKIVEIVSWAAGNGDRSENADYQYGRQRLRQIDRRMRFLAKRLENALIVKPEDQKTRHRVFFGATVKVVNEDDITNSFTILGVDEAQMERSEVSIVSPLARAILGASVGDERIIKSPEGDKFVEILEITYPETEESL